MSKFFSLISRSIFLKLLLIFLVTTGLIITVAGGLVRGFTDDDWVKRRMIHRNVSQYVDYIADEIGDPPDTGRAEALAQRLGLQIYIDGKDGAWSSEPGWVPDTRSLHLRTAKGRPNLRWGRRLGRFFIVLNREGARFVFSWGRDPTDHRMQFFLILAAALGLILLLAYLAVRWLFRPVKWLNQGVAQLSQGELDTRIPVRKHDELGELAESFNHMAERLREMMRAKTQLLLDVSHELRSPLARIKLALEFVPESDPRQRIDANIGEMEAMVGEILESERLSSSGGGLEREPVELGALIERVVDRYQNQPPGARISGSLTEVVLPLDAKRIEIVLRNLIENGIKYSSQQMQPVEVSLNVDEAFAQVHVNDHGSGIPEAEQGLIFEPFYRTDKSRHKDTGGYGLGLSLCKKIMEAHGGRISVMSRPGAGATFTLTLPRTGE